MRFSPTGILRALPKKPDSAVDWSKTLDLPKSTFPARSTAAQLAQYRRRCADDLYAWQRANRPAEDEFILHDGPPYANGAVHVGHALNKILKDLILRSEMSRGKRVHYRPGWDCHGLPIEHKALQALRTGKEQATALQDDPKEELAAAPTMGMSASEVRSVAAELASKTIEEQKKSFREWGVMGEWDEPYKTMSKDFEIRQLSVFREIVKKGLIFRDHRPVYWSPSSRTALAEAELEYDDQHKCTAAFVKMPFAVLPTVLAKEHTIKAGSVAALIWTTTPWSLPANKAIAVKADLEYTVIELSNEEEEQLVVAKDRVEHVISHLGEGTTARTVIDSITGAELADGSASAYNLFSATESPIVTADFVSSTSGTGLVHMAPGHGMEDYQVCQKYGIGPAFAPVDDEGRFTADVAQTRDLSAMLKGKLVETEGVQTVLDVLNNPTAWTDSHQWYGRSSLVLAAHEFVHKNPIDWRTKKPVITRATAQWFADLSLIKDRAVSALQDVHFYPESGRTRLNAFVEGRSQWCISRQRSWGVPIPALYHKVTREALISDKSIWHIINTIKERGTDAWFSDPPDEPAWIHSDLQPGVWVRGKDTMDVWFDSGTTWTTLLREQEGRQDRPLSDVYVEGSDQHRGWFQSSLLTHVSTQEKDEKPNAPYGTLLTHGFVLDGEGSKMSKSLGNVISPDQIISGELLPPLKPRKNKGKHAGKGSTTGDQPKYDSMGPDLLRLWVASSDYTRDVPISQQGLQGVQQALQKYRVTLKFLLGVLHDYPSPGPDESLLMRLGFNDKPMRERVLHDSSSSANDSLPRALGFADKLILHRLSQRSNAIWQAYRDYKFHEGVREINNFVNVDFSAFYVEVVKDCLYAGLEAERRHTQTVLMIILHEMLQWLGTVTPFLVEETWPSMPDVMKVNNLSFEELEMHPLRQVWEGPYQSPVNTVERPNFEELVALFEQISKATKVAQEKARTAGHLKSGLACRVEVLLFGDLQNNAAEPLEHGLADLLVVSDADLISTEEYYEVTSKQNWLYEEPVEGFKDARVRVMPPSGRKCVRCWQYTADTEDEPCERCQIVLAEKGFDSAG